MPKANKKELTIKEKTFVAEMVKTKGNKTQSALAAYNTDKANAPSIGYENSNKPHIRKAIDQAFKSLNITPKKILKRFDKEAEQADNSMARIRANENLADIADMYPKANASLDLSSDGLRISWQE